MFKQKSPLCKLELGGEKSKCKFNNSHVFVNAFSSHECVGKVKEPKYIKKRQSTTFDSHKAKGKAKVQTFHNHISKKPTCNYCDKNGHVKVKCRKKYKVQLGLKRWIP